MIEADLYDVLNEIAPTYPIKVAQDSTYPAITYLVVVENPEITVDGDALYTTTNFQVDIWSDGYLEGKTIKNAVISAVRGLLAYEISIQDIYEDDTELYRQLLDFKIRR